jgi:hypothetical protein
LRVVFDWDRVQVRMIIEREMVDMEKHEKWLKMDLEKVKTFETIDLEKEKVRLARDTKELGIMLQDTSLLDDKTKKWYHNKKKEINERNKGGNCFIRVAPTYELLNFILDCAELLNNDLFCFMLNRLCVI